MRTPEAIRERHERVCAYYAQGHSMRETAAQFDLSIEGVRYVLLKREPQLIRKPNVSMSLAPAERLVCGARS